MHFLCRPQTQRRFRVLIFKGPPKKRKAARSLGAGQTAYDFVLGVVLNSTCRENAMGNSRRTLFVVCLKCLDTPCRETRNVQKLNKTPQKNKGARGEGGRPVGFGKYRRGGAPSICFGF
jgi:hypothetical protein